MTTESPPRRPRGRPRKPKPPAPPPRYPPLPFQETRDRLAALLRKSRKDEPPPPAHELASVATKGMVSLRHAIAGPLGRPFRLGLTPEDLAKAAAMQAKRNQHDIKGLAANSLRTRASDWLTWLAYCAHNDCVVIPADFDDLAPFIRQLIAAGRKKATIEHILWSIADVHRRHGCADPMDNDLARDFWRDRVRQDLSGEQKQAQPLRWKLLQRLVNALATAPITHRATQERLVPTAIRAQERRRLRDIAMLRVAYNLLTRSNELVRMEWDRIEKLGDGSGLYRFGKTKTDQEGKGTLQYLDPETMDALTAWQGVSPIGGHVFHAVAEDTFMPLELAESEEEQVQWKERMRLAHQREMKPLTEREVATVLRRACVLAGVDPNTISLSGHSARVGAVQDMVSMGATTVQVQIEGRWKTERMPAHYAAKILATNAGKSRYRKLRADSDGEDADT